MRKTFYLSHCDLQSDLPGGALVGWVVGEVVASAYAVVCRVDVGHPYRKLGADLGLFAAGDRAAVYQTVATDADVDKDAER